MAVKKGKKSTEGFSANPMMEQLNRLRPFIEDNIRQLGAILLVVCIAAAAVVWWNIQDSRKEQKAHSLFAATLNFMSGGANAASDNSSKVYQRALASFNAIIDKYPDTRAGVASRMYAGTCSYRLGQYDEAVKLLEGFLSDAPEVLSGMKPMAQENLGYIYEEQEQYREALKWFEKARENQSDIAAASGLISCARCLEQLGETDRACQYYEDYVDMFPSATFVEFARTKVSALCEKD